MVKREPTGWVGWVYFASALLMIAGGLQIIAGLTSIFNSNFYVVTQAGNLIALNYQTWGWIHLLIGIVALSTGLALAAGKLWAQVLAVVIAVFSAIANLAFISVYPWWSIIALIIDGLVIYAITLHGDEVRD